MAEDRMFVTWGEGDAAGMQRALASIDNLGKSVEPVARTTASNVFNNIAPGNVSVRDGFSRLDYESFRLGEARPVRAKDQIAAAMLAYEEHGPVYNVINLMADFSTKGARVVHQNERVENWWKEWWRQVRGPGVSERLANYLTRCGVAIPKRQTAKIPVRVEKKMRRMTGSPDVDAADDYEFDLEKREIPWAYNFLHPLTVDVVGEDIAPFMGSQYFQFALSVPRTIASRIRNPKQGDASLIKLIPADVKSILDGGSNKIPLDPSKVSAYYYKRDDWRVWAMPMITPILKDLRIIEKMKLADMAALDGAISCIRVWKLGNIEARILPTEVAINRLAQILQNNVGGGVLDLIWGPEIELIETSTEVYKFLGEEKYLPHLKAVYQGLGIPSAFAGSGNSAGFTTDFFSLKTLTDRLEYVRSIVVEFWEKEFRDVQRAMGFRFPAKLVFDHMDLGDPAAQKQLWLRLAEEDIISWETVVTRFGEDPDLEEARLRREHRKRQSGKLPPKASPYHDPQQDYGLKKIFAQTGVVTPSEVGVELDERVDGQVPTAERTSSVPPPDNRKGTPGQGRPKGAKDQEKRKQKEVKPRTSASFLSHLAWAENAQAAIHKVAGPAYLKSMGKSNFREIGETKARAFEEFKLHVLFALEPGSELTDSAVKRAVAGKLSPPSVPLKILRAAVSNHVNETGREPSLEVLRRLQSGVYAMWHEASADPDHGLPAVP